MVLIRPILSEKSVKLMDSAKYPRYTFEVAMEANKWDIAEAVEAIYNVKVASVNTMVVRGKRYNRYSKKGVTHGKASNFKKAIVVLNEGDSIDFYQNL